MKNKVGADMETAQQQRMNAMTKDAAQKPARDASAPAKGKPAHLSGKDAEKLDQLSNSLQKAYQQTVSEDVPDSMMDLLKRLG